jgi:hypothetical protein
MDLMDGGIAPPTSPQPQQQSKKIQFKGEGAAGEAVYLLPENVKRCRRTHPTPDTSATAVGGGRCRGGLARRRRGFFLTVMPSALRSHGAEDMNPPLNSDAPLKGF